MVGAVLALIGTATGGADGALRSALGFGASVPVACVSFAVSAWASRQRNPNWLLGVVLGGMPIRMLFAVGVAIVPYWWLESCGIRQYWLWVGVGYAVTLALEVAMLVPWFSRALSSEPRGAA